MNGPELMVAVAAERLAAAVERYINIGGDAALGYLVSEVKLFRSAQQSRTTEPCAECKGTGRFAGVSLGIPYDLACWKCRATHSEFGTSPESKGTTKLETIDAKQHSVLCSAGHCVSWCGEVIDAAEAVVDPNRGKATTAQAIHDLEFVLRQKKAYSAEPCNEHIEGCIAPGVHRMHRFATPEDFKKAIRPTDARFSRQGEETK